MFERVAVTVYVVVSHSDVSQQHTKDVGDIVSGAASHGETQQAGTHHPQPGEEGLPRGAALGTFVGDRTFASPWRTLGLSVPFTARTAQLITTGYGRVRAAVAGSDECNV
ncbi:hypothetical protein Pcinc_038532 [Petrolisthes cinctipes]|uniref:Uncharacterized protein n=1 Tax=Petrolisthes cinctipes TaxID=88211 RepID=A0AAE1BQC4_PETCI|nr:hypothetical protein Pcinc_038532 [Petrolisthes cinctipes]